VLECHRTGELVVMPDLRAGVEWFPRFAPRGAAWDQPRRDRAGEGQARRAQRRHVTEAFALFRSARAISGGKVRDVTQEIVEGSGTLP